jgi:hypothetical protein
MCRTKQFLLEVPEICAYLFYKLEKDEEFANLSRNKNCYLFYSYILRIILSQVQWLTPVIPVI